MGTTWLIIGLAAVFILVIFNNKRNMKRLRDRRDRNFGEHYYDKKKQKDTNEDIHKDG